MTENKKILIVDDDMSQLDLVELLFEKSGFEVLQRANGESALEFLENASVDAILIDLMMPGMSGDEAIAEMRKRGCKLPIVAFTAADDPTLHEKARNAGCDSLITKPFKPAALVGEVTRLIEEGLKP